MRYHLTPRCDQHDDPFDCPDQLIWHSAKRRRWGLIIHDGGASMIKIKFCPWCGAKLRGDAPQ
ncbi:hypothetical protein R9X44_18110 [Actinocorallia sp. A-T 12471]|nr:hypothetical protein [Actinocorallia sp. A-T 12471]MDX6741710.1 hypothetical protein [Actinocorallia sp. A-T 12471]